ncbi:MAG: 2-C-methyl-D-erythritol 4-phosphate cytidylyltransferase [bacterium]
MAGDRPFASAVLLAAGSGKRAGLKIPKQFVKLNSRFLFEYSLRKLEKSKFIRSIVLVVPRDYGGVSKLRNPKVKIVFGGCRRQDSLLNGVREICPQTEVVLVHDSARPFITEKMIKMSVLAAYRSGGAVLAVPCRDTMKVAEYGFVKKTVPRKMLFEAQTPQAFRAEFLGRMKKLLSGKTVFTDEAAVLEKMRVPVKIIAAESINMKITTAEDLRIAEVLMKSSAGNSRRI